MDENNSQMNQSMPLIKRVKLDIKPPDYQPSQGELNEEFDKPGVDIEIMRKAVFQLIDLPKARKDFKKWSL